MSFKTSNLKFSDQTSSEDGVTLLLSVFILAAISLISMAVGFFALQEIRASRAVLYSEPAITAAESGGEIGLWTVKRAVGTLSDCPDVDSYNIGNSRIDLCKTYGSATLDIQANTTQYIYLYDVNDINGNLCMNQTYTVGVHSGCGGGALYTNLSFVRRSGTNNVTITAKDLAGNNVGLPSYTLGTSPGSTVSINVPDPIPASNDERMVITLTSVSNATVEVNSSPRGLPDTATVSSAGCSSNSPLTNCSGVEEIFKRRIEITVPQ